MKRFRILEILCCMLLLTGCGKTGNSYRVDTVVRIPVNPTEASETAAPTETNSTEEMTEASEMTEATEPEKASSAAKSSSGGKTSSGKKTESESPTEKPVLSGGISTVQATEPKITGSLMTSQDPKPTEVPETAAPAEVPYDPGDYSVGSLEYAILDELNDRRAEEGLPELTMNSRLCGIAALRAREAAQLWSHTRPDGRNYATAMSDYGFSFSTSAENLAHVSGSGDAAAIVSKWMDTDSRNSILGDGFTTAGVGVYRAGGVTYVVNLLVG